MAGPHRDTRSDAYSRRLEASSAVWWKRWLDVQAPYRWNLRRLDLGFVLDVGCGLGRNLGHLGGFGVGIDHNPHSVERARLGGLLAFTPESFENSPHAKAASYDSLLFAHVLEHMNEEEASRLVAKYLGFLRPGGRVLMITPQEAGFRSDDTHVHFLGFDELLELVGGLGLEPLRAFSFPLPRFAGRFFRHNEFVVVARKPARAIHGTGVAEPKRGCSGSRGTFCTS